MIKRIATIFTLSLFCAGLCFAQTNTPTATEVLPTATTTTTNTDAGHDGSITWPSVTLKSPSMNFSLKDVFYSKKDEKADKQLCRVLATAIKKYLKANNKPDSKETSDYNGSSSQKAWGIVSYLLENVDFSQCKNKMNILNMAVNAQDTSLVKWLLHNINYCLAKAPTCTVVSTTSSSDDGESDIK